MGLYCHVYYLHEQKVVENDLRQSNLPVGPNPHDIDRTVQAVFQEFMITVGEIRCSAKFQTTWKRYVMYEVQEVAQVREVVDQNTGDHGDARTFFLAKSTNVYDTCNFGGKVGRLSCDVLQ